MHPGLAPVNTNKDKNTNLKSAPQTPSGKQFYYAFEVRGNYVADMDVGICFFPIGCV